MFKTNFIKLCNEKGVSPTFACKEIGLSNSVFAQWNDNSIPRQATLLKIADYFGITVDQLLGKETDTIDQQLEGEDFAVWGEFKELTIEEKTEVLNFINFIKSKRK